MLHELYGDILEISGHEIVANAYDGDEAVEIFGSMEESRGWGDTNHI